MILFILAEVQCSDPQSVKDGFIEVSNFKGRYVFGSLATYHCNPGYILWGNASRLCAEDGIWTGNSYPCSMNKRLGFKLQLIFYNFCSISGKRPQCKPITCGQPPEVLNARFQLTNGTSTSWQSLARYTCKPGFKMVYQNSKCQHLVRPPMIIPQHQKML